MQGAGGGESLFVASESGDSTITLEQARVVARRATRSLRVTGETMEWSTALMQQMPRIAGNADPIHYAQMLPGVQTNGEYRGGINVQGCDNAHTMVSIGGVPIYNANHLLGIFSTFNPTHYSGMKLQKSARSADFPSRLGAHLDMQLPSLADGDSDSLRRWSGNLECGIMSSQGTLQIQPGENTRIVLSGRGSYLNLLYGWMMQVDDSPFRYTFGDANVTVIHRRGRHTFTLDSYYGEDAARVEMASAVADFRCRWGNNMQALHWDREGSVCSSVVLSHSAYRNAFNLELGNDRVKLPSSIDDYTLRADMVWQRLRFGAQTTCYSILSQYPELNSTYIESLPPQSRRQSGQLSLYVDYDQPLWSGEGKKLSVNMGIRPTLYLTADRSIYAAADPHVSVQWRSPMYDISVVWAQRHQYLFFSGITDMGLPTEYWMSANAQIKPQWAHGFNASAGLWLPGRRWRLNVDGFYKRMHRQQECVGTMFDYLTGDYHPERMMCECEGHNYGGSLMLSHPVGALTGWVSYTYTRAARRSDDIHTTSRYFSAIHERPHEFNAVVAYTIRRHWQLSSTAVVASGTPFTAPQYFYLLGANLVSHYGEHNANRLPPYCRIDLSCSYRWNTRRRVHQSINVSIYNATARKNALFYALCVHKDGNYHYKPTSFLTSVLPSVSYSIQF